MQNRAFNKTDHDFELTLNQNSVLELCENDAVSREALAKIKFKFTPINKIEAMKAEVKVVDVIGVAVEVNELKDVTTRAGKTVRKREVTLMSGDSAKVGLTLWAEEAERFSALNKVVAVKSAKIAEWNGVKSLNLSFGGALEVDPDLDEAAMLRIWFEDNKHSINSNPESSHPRRNFELSGADFVTLAEMKGRFNSGGDDLKVYNVEAYVTEVNSEVFSYKSCGSGDCNRKKVNADGICGKCGQKDNFIERFVLRASLTDMTDNQWVTAFDEVAREAIFGGQVDAAEMVKMRVENPIKFGNVIYGAKFKRYRFRLNCKRDNYNGQDRLKVTVINALLVDAGSKEHIERLKNEVERLQGSI